MSVCYLKSVKKRRCADVLKNQNICPGDAGAELRGRQDRSDTYHRLKREVGLWLSLNVTC